MTTNDRTNIFIHCPTCGLMRITKRDPSDKNALVVQIDCPKCSEGNFSPGAVYIGKAVHNSQPLTATKEK